MSISEQELAQRLGISRAILKELREEAEEGEHFVNSRPIQWTDAGMAWVEDRLTSATFEGEANESSEKSSGARISVPEAPPRRSRLTVVRQTRNRHILLARLPGTDCLQRVRVKDSTNYVPGMEIQARHRDGDLWIREGRSPRYRGKW